MVVTLWPNLEKGVATHKFLQQALPLKVAERQISDVGPNDLLLVTTMMLILVYWESTTQSL